MGICFSIHIDDSKFEVTPDDIKERVQKYLENMYGDEEYKEYDIPTISNNICTYYLVRKNEICRMSNESIIVLISRINFLKDKKCIITYYNNLNAHSIGDIPTVNLFRGYKITLVSQV